MSNKSCEKNFCIYHRTCLISDLDKIKKCTGILSEKNPQHPDYNKIILSTGLIIYINKRML